jgi:hypothetical protein
MHYKHHFTSQRGLIEFIIEFTGKLQQVLWINITRTVHIDLKEIFAPFLF